jgi:beta-carotene 3-hydroxylase
MLLKLLLCLLSFLFMEFVAWFTHKYLMHGFLWLIHKDHHLRNHKFLEWNDLFALIFAIPSILLIINGVYNSSLSLYIGLGIAAYGLAYFLFHDSLVHGRIKLLKGINNNYFRAVLSAHLSHHSGMENYGFLFMFNWKFFKSENQVDFDNHQYI